VSPFARRYILKALAPQVLTLVALFVIALLALVLDGSKVWGIIG